MTSTSTKPKYFYATAEENNRVEMLYAAYQTQSYYLTYQGAWQPSGLNIEDLETLEQYHPVAIYQIEQLPNFTPHNPNATTPA